MIKHIVPLYKALIFGKHLGEPMILCSVSDLVDGESRGFELEGLSLFIVKQGDQLSMFKNSCPHRGIRLEWQPDTFLDVEKQFIQCATHGALFTINSGECIAGPCPGERLEAIAFTIVDGMIRIDI
jgi:nitrite reductase/ring-hydroxylating ferredoxin subunit